MVAALLAVVGVVGRLVFLALLSMSIRVMSEVWARSRARGTTLLVMLAYADNADDKTRLAWPSNENLMRRARAGLRSIQRAKREGEELGELELVEPGRPGRSAVYRVSAKLAHADDTRDAGERQECRSDATQVSPQPSIDPSRELSDSSSAPAGESAEEGDLPDHLRPALEAVWPILERVAQAKPSSAPPTREAVARAIATFPDRDHVDAASDLEQWLCHGTGRKTQVADVVQNFRRALARGRPVPASTEPATPPTATTLAPRYDRALKR